MFLEIEKNIFVAVSTIKAIHLDQIVEDDEDEKIVHIVITDDVYQSQLGANTAIRFGSS